MKSTRSLFQILKESVPNQLIHSRKLRKPNVPINSRIGWIDRSKPSGNLEAQFKRGVPHFQPGHSEVHLPNFVVALVRAPELSPYFARFRVPLWFNKLDLRDYLYHGYGVRAFNVRSAVKQRPIELIESRDGKQRHRYHRKRALKFMTIEMSEPFYWPEIPAEIKDVIEGRVNKDASAETDEEGGFNTQLWREQQEVRDKKAEGRGREIPWFEGSDDMLYYQDGPGASRKHTQAMDTVRPPTVKEMRDAYAAEAERLLAGREKWKPTWKTMQNHVFLTPRDGKQLSDSESN